MILPYLAIDEFPRSKTDPLEEENRFYVAATRARDRLSLLTPQDPAHQSRYIAALQLKAKAATVASKS